jgi:hypothetical protein
MKMYDIYVGLYTNVIMCTSIPILFLDGWNDKYKKFTHLKWRDRSLNSDHNT